MTSHGEKMKRTWLEQLQAHLRMNLRQGLAGQPRCDPRQPGRERHSLSPTPGPVGTWRPLAAKSASLSLIVPKRPPALDDLSIPSVQQWHITGAVPLYARRAPAPLGEQGVASPGGRFRAVDAAPAADAHHPPRVDTASPALATAAAHRAAPPAPLPLHARQVTSSRRRRDGAPQLSAVASLDQDRLHVRR
eukprot:CAMPEP_0180266222 /NCGR_PEP_ID=MMETSP0988-20121125/886_1 /TAXON_ID=697907 /ORGANISM="non described non described, Strain CCMP2293" /LENGTH=190 /DNA_ID=CAMNT_0022236791 /DNA_START=69 /DNA_END=642 /DNA_ORIENTATION=-